MRVCAVALLRRRAAACTASLVVCRRAQSMLSSHGDAAAGAPPAARYSKAAYRHPLAPRDPAQRNVAIAPHAHAKAHSADTQSPALLRRRAQRALLRQMQQDVLWEGTVLDTADHALIQHFVRLARNAKYRAARHLMLVGGRELIRELCARGHRPRHLLVVDGALVPTWAQRLRDEVELVRVTRPVAEACVPGNDGFIGDFDIPAPPPKERLIVNAQRYTRVLVLDNVDDAGVLGTVLRTACALQYDAIIATNHCADLYDHRVVRAARGAHFQAAVPIYTLRDEDGDDVYGMINHVLRRNELLPVCYAAQDDRSDDDGGGRSAADEDADDDDGVAARHARHTHSDDHHVAAAPAAASSALPSQPQVFVSSVVGAAPIALPTTTTTTTSGSSVMQTVERLSEFCLRHFAPPPPSQQRQQKLSTDCGRDGSHTTEARERGYVVFVGPNHTRTMLRRLPRRVAAPMTRLLLDADMPATTDALIGYSLVLNALRPHGEWDYMPLCEQQQQQQPQEGARDAQATATAAAAGVQLQTQRLSVDLGPNRLCLDETHLSWDEDEQRQAADERNAFMKWQRLHRRRLSDYEHWVTAEERRIAAALRQQRARATTPWLADAAQTSSGRPSRVRGAPAWVPNIIDEYRMPLDRDALRAERERSEAFVRPDDNYRNKLPRT